METSSVRPSVTFCQRLKSLFDFHEIRNRRYFKTLSSKHEFCKNTVSDSRTFHKGVNKFIPVRSIFLIDFD